MAMAAAASNQGTILGCLWTAHLLPRPKEWKGPSLLEKDRKGPKKGKKKKKEENCPPIFSGKRHS